VVGVAAVETAILTETAVTLLRGERGAVPAHCWGPGSAGCCCCCCCCCCRGCGGPAACVVEVKGLVLLAAAVVDWAEGVGEVGKERHCCGGG
jgi:hypothetical protein